MSDPTPLIATVLSEHRHKPPRVQARLVADAIGHLLALDDPEPVESSLPEPFDWAEFRSRLEADPQASLVDFGLATTRNRTHGAMRALGLDPHEVRAVVIEPDWVRVYRWRTAVQTVPVLEEKTA